MQFLLPESINRRTFWIGEIANISGHFVNDSAKLEAEISQELKRDGLPALLDHIRTCGVLPEQYGHDSTEEKLYSKYTDVILAVAFAEAGLKTVVVTERGDAADVEAVGPDYSFVADAKAFRLSRTAKNQKDFKVEAMHSWKRAHRYAVVVCPLYQLPSKSSQIYLQATARDVLILSYSHLAVLVRSAEVVGKDRVVDLLHTIFEIVSAIPPTKDSVAYWTAINREFLKYHDGIAAIYKEERIALLETIDVAREEALMFLSQERKRIMSLTQQEAISQLIKSYNIDGRINTIKAVSDNKLFTIS